MIVKIISYIMGSLFALLAFFIGFVAVMFFGLPILLIGFANGIVGAIISIIMVLMIAMIFVGFVQDHDKNKK